MYLNVSRFLSGVGSQLDGQLSKQNVTLQQILDEDVLSEIKTNGSQKFANFVIKNVSNYRTMIQFLLEQDSQKLIRYQFMVSEILSSDNSILIDYLFEPERNIPNFETQEPERKLLLPKLFEAFQSDYLNITTAGYLSKVIQSIMRKRGSSLWSFIKLNDTILSNLIKHIDVSHVADIIERLINYDQNKEDNDRNDHIVERKQLLQRVINLLLNKIHQSDIVNNCCQILMELCVKSDQFFELLNQPDNFYFAACNSGSVQFLNIAILLLEAILKSLQSGQVYDYVKFNKIASDLHRQFSCDKMDFAFATSYGTINTPLSQYKLRLLVIYYLLLQTNNKVLISLINHTELYRTLQDYILKFEFNNQLQNLFYEITTYIYKNPSLEYVQIQITQQGLFKFISNNNKLTKQLVGQLKKPISRGYNGILSKLSYTLEQYADNSEEWNTYQSTTLVQLKKVEQQYIFGINPKSQSDQEEQAVNESLLEIQQRLEHHRKQKLLLTQADEEQSIKIGIQNDDEYNDTPQVSPLLLKPPLKLDTQLMQQTIQDVIICSETSPRDVQDILTIQEYQNNLCSSPQTVETQLDKTVNKYWKTHEHFEDNLHSHKHDLSNDSIEEDPGSPIIQQNGHS